MTKRLLDAAAVEAACLGGTYLGGGGGGSLDAGLEMGLMAVRMGPVNLVSLDEFEQEDIVITASAVGAPAAREKFASPRDYVEVVQRLLDMAPVRPAGIATNENGPMATVNGWLQAAVLQLPVVDCPCNGRAHPTGHMGAMGLHHLDGYTSYQVAIGGRPDSPRRVEASVSGAFHACTLLVRSAAVHAGGLVAVARDPIAIDYASENGAPGAISQSIAVGEAMKAAEPKGVPAVVDAALELLGGRLILRGEVAGVSLETVGGYDVGRMEVVGNEGRGEVTFWNEYMTLEIDGERLYTFPDLIVTISPETGRGVSSAAIRQGVPIWVAAVPRQNLILGAGMRDPDLIQEAARVVGKSL